MYPFYLHKHNYFYFILLNTLNVVCYLWITYSHTWTCFSNLYDKISFCISGNPLLFNTDTHIYFLRRIQCSFICPFCSVSVGVSQRKYIIKMYDMLNGSSSSRSMNATCNVQIMMCMVEQCHTGLCLLSFDSMPNEM